ncbi:hypothetical protein GCM10009777_10880 [Microbacterium pumilum]|uniref:Uncharacterized protein n=1 Tax=Microbacterium pumilum TaxID=344165 RepID=A0ABN2S2S0_9MICO
MPTPGYRQRESDGEIGLEVLVGGSEPAEGGCAAEGELGQDSRALLCGALRSHAEVVGSSTDLIMATPTA